MRASSCAAILLSCFAFSSALAQPQVAGELVHRGTCDASAAVAIDGDRMLVANDEDNVLRLYRSAVGGAAIAETDLTEFLEVDPDDPEADIEAATTLGELHIWITSHGRAKDGDEKPSRRRLFATRLAKENGAVVIRGAGRPYKELVADLSRAETLQAYDFASASTIAPTKPGGLNIEGLAAMPDGSLLVGLRGPLREGRAMIVSIENPLAVLNGSPAQFGAPVELDLGGLGIRGMEYVPKLRGLLIVAGSLDESNRFRLYRWSGDANDDAHPIDKSIPRGFAGETLVVTDEAASNVRLLSDDGSRIVGGETCKSLDDAELRSFRSLPIPLD